jgi:hypothetical protein
MTSYKIRFLVNIQDLGSYRELVAITCIYCNKGIRIIALINNYLYSRIHILTCSFKLRNGNLRSIVLASDKNKINMFA